MISTVYQLLSSEETPNPSLPWTFSPSSFSCSLSPDVPSFCCLFVCDRVSLCTPGYVYRTYYVDQTGLELTETHTLLTSDFWVLGLKSCPTKPSPLLCFVFLYISLLPFSLLPSPLAFLFTPSFLLTMSCLHSLITLVPSHLFLYPFSPNSLPLPSVSTAGLQILAVLMSAGIWGRVAPSLPPLISLRDWQNYSISLWNVMMWPGNTESSREFDN